MSQIQPGGTGYGVFELVAKWNNTVALVPDWATSLEYEFIRESGRLNMFTDDVERHALECGLLNVATWLRRCKGSRIQPWALLDLAHAMHESKHGPRSTWLSDGVRDDILRSVFEHQRKVLNQNIKNIPRRTKKSAKGKASVV